MNLFTDASLTGYGAFYGGAWLFGEWVGAQLNHPIAWKELAAIIIASLTWETSGRARESYFIATITRYSIHGKTAVSRSSAIMGLLWRSFLIAAEGNFAIRLSHVSVTDNSIADALSRSQVTRF